MQSLHQSRLIAAIDRRKGTVLLSVLLLTTLPYPVLSFFTTPGGDDFSYAATALYGSWTGAQSAYYLNWTGRYTATFMQTTAPFVGDYLVGYKFFSCALILHFYLSLWMLVSVLWDGRLWRRAALLPALLLLALCANTMPTVLESFYWLAAGFTYQLGLNLGLMAIAFLLARGRPALTLILALVSTAAAVGCSEITSFMLLSVLGAGTGVQLYRAGFRWRAPGVRRWAAALLVAGAGFAVVYFCPGNAARAQFFPHAGKLAFVLPVVGERLLDLATLVARSPALWLGLLLCLPLARRLNQRHQLTRVPLSLRLLGVAFLALVLLGSVVLPAWAMGVSLALRTANSQLVFLLLAGFGIVVLFADQIPRRLLRQRHGLVGLFLVYGLCLSLVSCSEFSSRATDLVIAPRFMAQCQARYDRIAAAKARGERHVAIPPQNYPYAPRSIAYYDISLDPEDGMNVALARYFQIESVVMELPDEFRAVYEAEAAARAQREAMGPAPH